MRFFPQIVLSAATVLVCGVAISGREAQPVKSVTRFDFKAKLLVVACDTDMLPSAYIDGKLGPAVGPDVLSIVRLDQGATSPNKLRATSIEVANSVTGPPAAVAVTPDGRYAIVAETQGSRPPDKPDATMKDLAPGKKITVVDLNDPDRPTVVQQIESYERPVSVAVNATGTTVTVAYGANGHSAVPLVLFPFLNGRLGHGAEPILPGYLASDKLSDAEFLPGGANGSDVLGVLFGSDGYNAKQRARVAFFTVVRGTLQPLGIHWTLILRPI